MNPVADARKHIAGLLAGVPVTVYDTPPETPTPPCVVIAPPRSGSWITRTRLPGQADVRLDVVVMVPVSAGKHALARLEELAWQVSGLVAATGPVEAPQRDQSGNVECWTVPVPVRVLAECEG